MNSTSSTALATAATHNVTLALTDDAGPSGSYRYPDQVLPW